MTSTAYQAPPKPAQKMSFYSEEQAAKVSAIRPPTKAQTAAARRVVAAQPDAANLAAMIFGATA